MYSRRNERLCCPRLILVVFAFFFASLSSCGGDGDKATETQGLNALAFFQSTQKITMEIWYEPAATPYEQGDWSILGTNLSALFQYRSQPPTVSVPTATADWHALSIERQESWTDRDILTLASTHNFAAAGPNEALFKVIFLDGYFHDGSGINRNVLGVSLGNSQVLALFKPVIAGTSKGLPFDTTAQKVEQVVLVHEMGHALGLVNNGVPMAVDHQDRAHGAHSLDKDCVMYWANESSAELSDFVGKFLGGGAKVLWGPEVLADVKAISK